MAAALHRHDLPQDGPAITHTHHCTQCDVLANLAGLALPEPFRFSAVCSEESAFQPPLTRHCRPLTGPARSRAPPALLS